MLFMLRGSFELMLLAVFIPELWVAFATIAITAALARRRHSVAITRRPVAELLVLAVPSVVMLVWGDALWPSDAAHRPPHETFALTGLYLFGAAQLALSIWLVWRHRARVGVASGIACAAAWWASGAFFLATMAVTNTWL